MNEEKKLADFLSQTTYKDISGNDCSKEKINSIATYKYIIDGVYSWICGKCHETKSDRSCGWSIAGLVLYCEKCHSWNLLLRNDIDWVNTRISRVSDAEAKLRAAEETFEVLSEDHKNLQKTCNDLKDSLAGKRKLLGQIGQ